MKNAIKVVTLLIFLLLIAFFIPTEFGNSKENFVSGYVEETHEDEIKLYSESKILIIEPNSTWLPTEKFNTSTQPAIAGEAGMMVELESGKIVFEKNANERRKIASLVKIMTAIVALEHKNLDDKIYVSKKAATIGENSMGLTMGEYYTLEELLYGLILNSGNDAAYAIAEGVAGDSDRFVEWMNLKAEELNLNDSRFYDPSGLNNDTYSTPKDLVILSRYAMQNENFRKIASTFTKNLPSSKDHKFILLENQTNLLTTYPGAGGIKTGYTGEAGLCLITYAQNDGKELIGVVLNSMDRKGDMILMLDHGFSTFGVNVEHSLLE